jgi:hypothetical protein
MSNKKVLHLSTILRTINPIQFLIFDYIKGTSITSRHWIKKNENKVPHLILSKKSISWSI